MHSATLVDLSTVAASLGKSGLAAGGLAEHNIAGSAQDDGLGVAKYGGDLEASGALDVHEEAIGGLHKSLELVRVGLGLRGGVEQIDRHFYWIGVGADGGKSRQIQNVYQANRMLRE